MSKRTISGFCQICGTYRQSLHRDHIIPKFQGGSNELGNIQLLCANCHEDKTREDLKARVISPEQREKIAATLRGRPLSDEHRASIGASQVGREFSAEHRAKISAGVRARYESDPDYRKRVGKREKTPVKSPANGGSRGPGNAV